MPRRGHGFAFQQISVPSPKQLCVYSTKELRVKGSVCGGVGLVLSSGSEHAPMYVCVKECKVRIVPV